MHVEHHPLINRSAMMAAAAAGTAVATMAMATMAMTMTTVGTEAVVTQRQRPHITPMAAGIDTANNHLKVAAEGKQTAAMAAATAVATTAENGGNGVVALMQRWQPAQTQTTIV